MVAAGEAEAGVALAEAVMAGDELTMAGRRNTGSPFEMACMTGRRSRKLVKYPGRLCGFCRPAGGGHVQRRFRGSIHTDEGIHLIVEKCPNLADPQS